MSTDALSDVLSAVQLSGSVFFDVTAKSPWVAEAPPAAQIADQVMPSAQHVIEYHVDCLPRSFYVFRSQHQMALDFPNHEYYLDSDGLGKTGEAIQNIPLRFPKNGGC